MLIQIMSDLHLETYPSYHHYKHKLTDAPYLALLGDIGHVCNDMLFELFRRLLDHYFVVFYLLGNHDPKDLTMQRTKARVRKFETTMAGISSERTIGKFVFLDQTRYDLNGSITILGCTLYSHVTDEQKNEVGSRMVDFRDTRGWTVEDHNAAHLSDLSWLNSQVEYMQEHEPQRKVIILTHHSPTVDPRANDPRRKNSPVSSGFVTDLSNEVCWKSPLVCVWAYGHTHRNCDFRDELTGKKVFANQKGYYKFPQQSFQSKATLLLPEGETQDPKDLEETSKAATHSVAQPHTRKPPLGKRAMNSLRSLVSRKPPK